MGLGYIIPTRLDCYSPNKDLATSPPGHPEKLIKSKILVNKKLQDDNPHKKWWLFKILGI